MTILDRKDALTLRQAAALLPGRPSRSTLHRWAHQGIRGVRLATSLIGGRRYTTREAIERFIAATSAREGPADVA